MWFIIGKQEIQGSILPLPKIADQEVRRKVRRGNHGKKDAEGGSRERECEGRQIGNRSLNETII